MTSDEEGSGYESSSRSFGTVWDNILSYKGTIKDIHSLDAVVGISFEHTRERYNATDYYTSYGGGTEYGLQSSFVRVNYQLMGRYLFTFTARYDGSSAFGSNNRFGFFPSGAVVWRISDEGFMSGVRFLDDMKIKFSVGKTGVQNFDLGSHANKDLYETDSYLGSPAIVHSQLGNRDLKWETTVQYDLGLDFSVLNSALSGWAPCRGTWAR